MKRATLTCSAFACLILLGLALPARGQYIQWTALNHGLDLGSGKGVTEVAAGGQDQGDVYAIVDGVGLFASTAKGQAWTKLAGDSPAVTSPYTLAVAPDDGNNVYVSTSAASGGLFQSTDGGKTFKQIGSKATGMAGDDVEWISICKTNPKLLVVGHRAGQLLSVSTDGGATWATKDMGAPCKRAMPIIIDEKRWVVSSRDGEVGVQAGGSNFAKYTTDGGATWADPDGDAGYFTGPMPMIESGDTLMSVRHHGFSRSVDAGKTWTWTMENHTRMVGAAGDNVFRELREGGRDHVGKDERIFALQMTSNFGQTWDDCTFNLINLVPENLRSVLIVSNTVDPFAHIRLATCFASTPDAQTIYLGLGKAGLYSGNLLFTLRGPRVAGATVTPVSVPEKDSKTRIVINVITSPRKSKIKKVYADLSGLGFETLELFDDGAHDDGAAGDKVYGNSFSIDRHQAPGTFPIGVISEAEDGTISSTSVDFTVASLSEKTIVWDGDEVAPRTVGWYSPKDKEHPLNSLAPTQDEAHNGKVSLEFHGEGGGYIGGGWNWHGFYPADAGTDIRTYRNLSFWFKVGGQDKPGSFTVSLVSNNGKATTPVDVGAYVDHWDDGEWHEAIIPLKDTIGDNASGFDAEKAWMLDISTWQPLTVAFSIYIDEIGFDNRPTRSHKEIVTLPEERDATPLGNNVGQVTVDVDTANPGLPISPYIYGAAAGDRAIANEEGLTIIRAGGNPVTSTDWKTGFSSRGADWFYTNTGKQTDPSQSWLVTFPAANKAANLESYLTIPISGRVAKDGDSFAFSTDKYPDQTDWAGKEQPTDPQAKAGSGIRYVRDDKGEIKKDANGKPVTELITADPNDTSIAVTPEEQTSLLSYLVNDMHYGTADKGGVKYVVLDNEPGIWHATHRGMHTEGVSYDGLWDLSQKCAKLLKQIDPSVKVSGPAAWGWSEYYYSGLDAQLCGEGKADWNHPPDYEKHGSVPFTKWYLQQFAKYEKDNGQRLLDILDWHFYPQNGLYMGGKDNDPATMESRVQETRVMWDPDYIDPSWMGKETGHHIMLLPMMKKWVAESYPGTQTALGEYSFGGEKDASGGVAEAELLGIYAREGLDYAFYWYFPAANSPQYFAMKLYRNPDGRHTLFGDKYLPNKNSAPTDCSVHCARDSKTGNLTFVVVNLRGSKGEHMTLNLGSSVPDQSVIPYEYGATDRFVIGQLPPIQVSGKTINVDLAPMSALRFDVKAQ